MTSEVRKQEPESLVERRFNAFLQYQSDCVEGSSSALFERDFECLPLHVTNGALADVDPFQASGPRVRDFDASRLHRRTQVRNSENEN